MNRPPFLLPSRTYRAPSSATGSFFAQTTHARNESGVGGITPFVRRFKEREICKEIGGLILRFAHDPRKGRSIGNGTKQSLERLVDGVQRAQVGRVGPDRKPTLDQGNLKRMRFGEIVQGLGILLQSLHDRENGCSHGLCAPRILPGEYSGHCSTRRISN